MAATAPRSGSQHAEQTHERHPLERCSSMPNAIDTIDAPAAVQLRLPSVKSKAHRRAQHYRNSVAVTNSDYYNAWRPQMSLLQMPHPLRLAPSAPVLEAISENETTTTFQTPQRPPSIAGEDDNPGPTFRYTPTPVLDPARQIPTPLSRPTTPQVPLSRPTTPQVPDSPMRLGGYGLVRVPSSRCSTPQAVPFTSTLENQFLPLFINPRSGNMYMFEDGYYVPLSPEQLQTFHNSAKVAVTQPPAPDRRTDAPSRQQEQQAQPPPPDYIRFVQLLLILYFLCCDVFVLAACSVPALICAQKVQKDNLKRKYDDAKRHSEYVMCFNISGIIIHVLLVLAVITTFLVLHFVFNVFQTRQ